MSEKTTHRADLSALRINREADEQKAAGNTRHRIAVIAVTVVLGLVLAIYLLATNLNSDPSLRVGVVSSVYPTQTDAILTASGYVVAQTQAAVASKGTGRLEYLGVEEGDAVRKAEIIARLEHSDVDAALEQARANLGMALASLEQDKANFHEAELHYQRQRDLLEKGLISGSEYDIAEARFKSAKAAVASGKARIDLANAGIVSAEVEVENTKIRAPFDGTVLTKNADIGEIVAPFSASSSSRGAVVTMADMNSLEVEADVSESNIQRVRIGQAFEIILDAFPSVKYPGYVHKVVPTADRAKATVLTKIRFKQLDQKVLPEMSAKVNFLSRALQENEESSRTVTAVAKSAIVTRKGRDVVFLVRDHSVTEIPISFGKEFGGQVEVLDGLSVGDKVVLNPPEELESGTTIKMVQ